MTEKIQSGLNFFKNALALGFEKGSEAMNLAAALVRGTKKLSVSLTNVGKEETK